MNLIDTTTAIASAIGALLMYRFDSESSRITAFNRSFRNQRCKESSVERLRQRIAEIIDARKDQWPRDNLWMQKAGCGLVLASAVLQICK